MVSEKFYEDIGRIRTLFPVVLDRIYFDHASDGPISAPAAEQMRRFVQICVREGKPRHDEYLEVVNETRMLAARLLNARPLEIAFVKNTSQGILIAMSSIPWRSGDNVVLLKDAFPANIYPWLNLIPDVEKRWIEIENGSEGVGERDFLQRLSARTDGHTRAVSIDWVHYLTGVRVELKQLGEFCREKGIFFIVDAIQGLGALEIDVREVKCDFLCAGGSKWLLSPHGTGILYVSQDRFRELKPSNIGWLSAQWDDFENFKERRPLRNGAERLEEGTLNLAGIFGMREALKMILSAGVHNIEERVIMLTGGLARGLLELDCEILTPLDSPRSGILSFRFPNIPSSKLWSSFSETDVVCSLREGWIRLSPHLYNTEEEVRSVVDCARDLIRG